MTGPAPPGGEGWALVFDRLDEALRLALVLEVAALFAAAPVVAAPRGVSSRSARWLRDAGVPMNGSRALAAPA